MVMSQPRGYAPYGVLAPARVPIVVYGTRWCAATQMVRRYLDRLGIPYRYVDLEADPVAAARLRWLSGGSLRHPTVAIGGELLVQPTLEELLWALARAGVL